MKKENFKPQTSNFKINPKLQIPTFWILRLVLGIYFGFFGLMFGFSAEAITGEQIINKVDANMSFKSGRFESKMIIYVNNELRIKEFITYNQGRDKSFAEFLSPPRDKGVKFLKIKDNMWMYLPSVEKIIKIAGHMLRQSMMGSDFSYEDALEQSKLLEKYNIKLIREETILVPFWKGPKKYYKKHPCYVLDLTAKVKKVTYYRRKIWVNKEVFLPVKEELFAKSGKKLKVLRLGDIQKFGKRYYPMYFSMRNLLRKKTKTEMVITKAEFDIPIPAGTFTQRNLRKR